MSDLPPTAASQRRRPRALRAAAGAAAATLLLAPGAALSQGASVLGGDGTKNGFDEAPIVLSGNGLDDTLVDGGRRNRLSIHRKQSQRNADARQDKSLGDEVESFGEEAGQPVEETSDAGLVARELGNKKKKVVVKKKEASGKDKAQQKKDAKKQDADKIVKKNQKQDREKDSKQKVEKKSQGKDPLAGLTKEEKKELASLTKRQQEKLLNTRDANKKNGAAKEMPDKPPTKALGDLTSMTKKEKKMLEDEGNAKLDKQAQKLQLEKMKKAEAKKQQKHGGWSGGGDEWWGKPGCICVEYWGDDGWSPDGWSHDGWSPDGWDGWWASGAATGMKKRDAAAAGIAKGSSASSFASGFASGSGGDRALGGWDEWSSSSGKSGKSKAKKRRKSKGSKKGKGSWPSSDWSGSDWSGSDDHHGKCKRWKCKEETYYPTFFPTISPTLSPTFSPSYYPTMLPTYYPTSSPETKPPTSKPTSEPSQIIPTQPTQKPTTVPSKRPSQQPTSPQPTRRPSRSPSKQPSRQPTRGPSRVPTKAPSNGPTRQPSKGPSNGPTRPPSKGPSNGPTREPSKGPTSQPTTLGPTKQPSSGPTGQPTTLGPTRQPSKGPTGQPTSRQPSKAPSKAPTKSPTKSPTKGPTQPTPEPSLSPSESSAPSPTTASPTESPTTYPPTGLPTGEPTTYIPTYMPTVSNVPSESPSGVQNICAEDGERFEPEDALITNFDGYQFGFNVALSNTSALVGAPGSRSTTNVVSGAAFVFDLDESENWVQTQALTPTFQSLAKCGEGVAIAEMATGEIYAVVGCPDIEINGVKTGAVIIYKRASADDEFQDVFELVPENGAVEDVEGQFGVSVAMNEDGWIAVGARAAPRGANAAFGLAYLYEPSGDDDWNLVKTFRPDVTSTSFGNFGWHVALSKTNTVVVGAPFDGGQNQGAFFIYKEVDFWDQFDRVTFAEPGGLFGFSLDIENDIVVVGARGAGQAFVYDISGTIVNEEGSAVLIQTIDPGITTSAPLFGDSVSLQDGHLAIGRPGSVGGNAVYIYRQNGDGTFADASQRVFPLDSGDTAIGFGTAVAINELDLFVGAPDSNTKGTESGSLFIYLLVKREECEQALPPIMPDDRMESLSLETPVNPISLMIPGKRYMTWSSLTETQKQVAQMHLGYSSETWNSPGSNEIEEYIFDELYDNAQSGADSLGFGGDLWDCHVNHYYGMWWEEMQDLGLDQHLTTLGWDESSWDNDGPAPETEDVYWAGLSDEQQGAASQLCYFEESWNGEDPIPDWPIQRRTLQ